MSAYVPGLPVDAAADSHAKAERGIRAVLAAYLNVHASPAFVRGALASARVRRLLALVLAPRGREEPGEDVARGMSLTGLAGKLLPACDLQVWK